MKLPEQTNTANYANNQKYLKSFPKSRFRFMEICSKNGFYLIEQSIDYFPYERQLPLTSSSKQQTDQLEHFILRYVTVLHQ